MKHSVEHEPTPEMIDLKMQIIGIPKEIFDKFWERMTAYALKKGQIVDPSNDMTFTFFELHEMGIFSEIFSNITAAQCAISGAKNAN